MKTFLPSICLFLLLAIAYASDTEDEFEEDEFEDSLFPRMAARARRPRRRGRRRGPSGGIKKPKCPTIRFKCGNMPRVCQNMRNAIRAGKPTTLHYLASKSLQNQNRRKACKGFKKSGLNDSCDEYPFASTREGGSGAIILAVPLKENKSQGGQLSGFIRKNKIVDGDCFKVQV